ncbi:DUF3278 domain-containing protein [Bacillus chungangensis]|uniref:Membrane protein n=1 Tax=Bacillus chungangensis TaxID=587633 RepID=A0ABT9WP35_9BACI|nr:DUF3278 domain-containing protein [Bacillus chungangensis]MDQ0174903.1 putative membrane protein [Bacillus chungangensis]
MEKSWLSFLLPDDEYKERKVVYFLAEGSIILLSVLVIMFSVNRILPQWGLSVEFVLGVSIVAFLFYVFIRYLFSGIEYTNVSTEQEFSKEKGHIIFKSITFMVIFSIVYLLFFGITRTQKEWFELIILLLLAGFFIFLVDYISLKRSYKKNKELLDDE